MKIKIYSDKVYLIGFWPDYEEFFFEGSSTKQLEVKTFNPSKVLGPKKIIFKSLIKSAKNKIYTGRIKHLMANNRDAFFIFQDSRLLLEFLANSKVSEYRCSVMFRNVVKTEQRTRSLLKKLKEKKIPIWSFDFKDCERYGLNFYPQFIKKYNDLSRIIPRYDFSFVGRDKNRSKWLYDFKRKAEAQGFSVYLDIRGDKKKDILTYKEYLTGMCQGRCFIDLVQKNQSGLTLRPLEAVLYGRKVISNNPNIENQESIHLGDFRYFDDKEFDLDISSFLSKGGRARKGKIYSPDEIIYLMTGYDFPQPVACSLAS